MKKALRLFALSVCLVVFLLASCDQNSLISHTPAIRGNVILPTGADVKGSDFYIRIMEGETAVYTGKVNADGSFVVEGLDEAKIYSILLSTEELGEINTSRDVSRATSSNGYGGWLRNVTASIDEQAGVGSVKVKPLGTIKGKVKRSGETEHYDIMVYIPGTSYMSVTDAEGNYSIFNVPQSTTAYDLRCISITGDWLPETITGVLLYVDNDTENPVKSVADKTIVKNAGTLLGTITKPGATDNSNITVLVENDEVSETGTTNYEGKIQITSILPGTYRVIISSTGFVTRTIDNVVIRASKDTSIGELTLTANGGDITGKISVNDEASLSGALITATSADKKYSYTTSSNSDGSFVIPNAYPTTYDIIITKTGYADSIKSDVRVTAGQSVALGEISMSSDFGTVSGIITDSKGNPIENAIVKLGDFNALTDSEGRFSKSGIAIGNYSVVISKNDYQTKTLDHSIIVTSNSTTIIGTVQLVSLYGTITGSVKVNDGKTVEGIVVSATDAAGSSFQVRTTSDGSYFFDYGEKILPGDYTVSAKADGYEDALRSVSVIADRNTEVDLLSLISKYGTLCGKIEDTEGNPLSGVSIAIGSLDTVTSKNDGFFRRENLPVGVYNLSITKEGYVDAVLEGVDVQSFIMTELADTVVLTPKTGTIYGRIRINGESDLSGVKVTVTQSGTGKQYYAYTAEDGSFSISATAGNYNQVEFTHSCCSIPPYNLENIALFANGSVEIKPKGSISSAYQIIFNHNYGVYETQASTCTERGYKKMRCWNCLRETIEYLDLLEHNNMLVDHQDPTCTEDGWNKYECSLCGQTITEELHATGHNWSKPVVLEVATCHSTGSQKITCSVCGAEETQSIEKLPHSWVDKGYADGKISYECSICGETEQFTDSTSILNISDWGSVSLKPSVDPDTVRTLIIPSEIDGITVTSVFTHTFQDCVNITQIVLPETLTTIESWAFAGCIGITDIDLPSSLTRIGDQAFRGCISLKSVVIPDGIERIEDYTFYGCSSLVSVTIPDSVTYLGRECLSGCSFDRIRIPNSVETIICYVFSDNTNLKEILIPKSVKYMEDRPFMGCLNLETIYIQSQTQPSGWVSSWNDTSARIVWGYTGELHYSHTESSEWNSSSTYHWHVCTECDEVMSMEKHDYAGETTKEPTCTETGVTTYTCSVCGREYTETIPALGHSYESEITKPATCTEKGERTYTCSVCGHSYTEEITSHHEYEETIKTQATCTEAGLKTLTCSICDDSFDEVIPALGHSHNETIIAATCTEDGLKTFMCERCGDTYTEVISALGHNYVASITKQATCEEAGIKTFTCSNCGDSYTEEIHAYGHYFTSWTTIQAATCYDNGLKSSKCFRCGQTVTEEIPKLEHLPVFKSDEANHWTECSLCGLILEAKQAHNYVNTEGDYVCNDCGYSESSLYYQVDEDGVLTPKDKSILPAVVRIPSNIDGRIVKTIGNDAFRDCTNITTLILSEGIEQVGENAFWYCTSITSLSLPSTLKEVGQAAFRGLERLKTLTIPGSLSYLPYHSFSLCHDLESIVIEEGVERIGTYALEEVFNNRLNYVEIPKSVTTIEEYAFRQCYIDAIHYAGTIADWNKISIDAKWRDLSTFSKIVCLDGELVLGNYEVDSNGLFYLMDRSTVGAVFEVPSSVNGKTVTGIGSNCFSDCKELTRVILPDTVTKLRWYCFSGCEKLECIENTQNIEELDYGVFYSCPSLVSLDFPNVEIWESDGATNCTSLTTVTISNHIRKIPKFNGCIALDTVVFHGTMSEWNRLEKVDSWCATTIAEYVECVDGNVKIRETDGIYSITLDGILSCSDYSSLPYDYEVPSRIGSITVKALAPKAFKGAHFTSVVIPEGVTSIGESCFENCNDLVNLSLPSTLKSIYHFAFLNCTSLKSVVIPNGVVDLHGTAFGGCTSLKSVQLPNSLTYLSGGSFSGCTNLESLVIPSKITDIHGGALSSSGFIYLEIPNTVKSIGAEAFQDCKSLESIVISKNISEISERLFRNCTSLNSIAFNGTVNKWNSLNKGSSWNEGVPATKVICIDGEVNI